MAKNRRTHSSLDKLPDELRSDVIAMIVDNTWPVDCRCITNANPTYDDVVDYCRQKGHTVSRSAVGRYAQQLRIIGRMKQAGVITRQVMSDLTGEKASATQKAVAEMITAATIEFISSGDNFDADEIRDVAKAMKDCTQIAINADKYIREQIKVKTEKAAEKVEQVAKSRDLDPETLKIIKEQIYGIAD